MPRARPVDALDHQCPHIHGQPHLVLRTLPEFAGLQNLLYGGQQPFTILAA